MVQVRSGVFVFRIKHGVLCGKPVRNTPMHYQEQEQFAFWQAQTTF